MTVPNDPVDVEEPDMTLLAPVEMMFPEAVMSSKVISPESAAEDAVMLVADIEVASILPNDPVD
jgi:hypothetical protein